MTVAEVMATTGEDVNDADIDDFINEFDGDGDGAIRRHP